MHLANLVNAAEDSRCDALVGGDVMPTSAVWRSRVRGSDVPGICLVNVDETLIWGFSFSRLNNNTELVII